MLDLQFDRDTCELGWTGSVALHGSVYQVGSYETQGEATVELVALAFQHGATLDDVLDALAR